MSFCFRNLNAHYFGVFHIKLKTISSTKELFANDKRSCLGGGCFAELLHFFKVQLL